MEGRATLLLLMYNMRLCSISLQTATLGWLLVSLELWNILLCPALIFLSHSLNTIAGQPRLVVSIQSSLYWVTSSMLIPCFGVR